MHSSFINNNNSPYLWLLKPAGLNRGQGIHLFCSMEDFSNLLQ